MTTTAYQPPVAPRYPKLQRPVRSRVIAGVAAGLSYHLKVDVLWVRLAFLVVFLLTGAGALMYAGLWLVSERTRDPIVVPISRRSGSRLVMWLGIAVTALLTVMSSNLSPQIAVAGVCAAIGALVSWLAFERGMRSRWAVVALVAGVGFVFAGVVLLAVLWSREGVTTVLIAVVLTLGGVGVLAAPWVVRSTQERAERLAADQRAEIASHLHDSVLQTLSLIQKRAADPAEVARLARSQERELRQWLFDPKDAEQLTVFGALADAAGEVEDLFGIRIAPVTVGEDASLTDAARAAVLAAREALVNVGKHAGVDRADVYAELLAGELTIFVRDRGRGFDPTAIGAGHHGLAESITGRVQRAGGRVAVTSAPGAGTEVEIAVPVS